MKKHFNAFLCLILCCISLVFTGCQKSEETLEAQSTTAPKATEQTTASAAESDPIIGTWKITDGSGTNYDTMSYVFKADSTVYLALGNTAFVGKYSYSKNTEGQDTLTANLYFGINGTYTYAYTNNENTLTLKANESTIVLTRQEDYNFMPEAPSDPVIDKKLLGNWGAADGNPITYSFFENGTMINNNYNQNITYAAYSAKDGEIQLTYNMGDKQESVYKYSFDGETLIIDTVKFKKIES